MIELAPCAEEHRWLLFEWRNRADVRRTMTRQEEIPAADHDRWFSRLLLGGDRRGWVVLRDHEPCGAVFVSGIDDDSRRGSLGMYIAEAAARGAGVGAAALFLVMRAAFEELRLHRFTCEVLASNTQARVLYDGFGFVHEGTLRDHVRVADDYVDLDLLAVLEDEWPTIRAEAAPRLRMRGLLP